MYLLSSYYCSFSTRSIFASNLLRTHMKRYDYPIHRNTPASLIGAGHQTHQGATASPPHQGSSATTAAAHQVANDAQAMRRPATFDGNTRSMLISIRDNLRYGRDEGWRVRGEGSKERDKGRRERDEGMRERDVRSKDRDKGRRERDVRVKGGKVGVMDWIAGVVDMKEGVRDEWCI